MCIVQYSYLLRGPSLEQKLDPPLDTIEGVTGFRIDSYTINKMGDLKANMII